MTLAVRRWLVPFLGLSLTLAAQQKRIYIAPDDHTDYMWTADEEAYRKAYLEMSTTISTWRTKPRAIHLEFQSRWHCDGSLWIWTYEQNRTPAQFARLIARVKTATSASLSTRLSLRTAALPPKPYCAACTTQARSNAGSVYVIPLAIAMENQTLPYGLGCLWAGSGAKYSWKGICGCLTQLHRNGSPSPRNLLVEGG